jgi:hypothetical protein
MRVREFIPRARGAERLFLEIVRTVRVRCWPKNQVEEQLSCDLARLRTVTLTRSNIALSLLRIRSCETALSILKDSALQSRAVGFEAGNGSQTCSVRAMDTVLIGRLATHWYQIFSIMPDQLDRTGVSDGGRPREHCATWAWRAQVKRFER